MESASLLLAIFVTLLISCAVEGYSLVHKGPEIPSKCYQPYFAASKNGFIYAFSGEFCNSNDLYRLDTRGPEPNSWTLINHPLSSATAPEGAMIQRNIFIDEEENVWLYYAYSFSQFPSENFELWKFQNPTGTTGAPGDCTWESMASGNPRAAPFGSGTYFNNTFTYYGGLNIGNAFDNNVLFTYDLHSNSWATINATKGVPCSTETNSDELCNSFDGVITYDNNGGLWFVSGIYEETSRQDLYKFTGSGWELASNDTPQYGCHTSSSQDVYPMAYGILPGVSNDLWFFGDDCSSNSDDGQSIFYHYQIDTDEWTQLVSPPVFDAATSDRKGGLFIYTNNAVYQILTCGPEFEGSCDYGNVCLQDDQSALWSCQADNSTPGVPPVFPVCADPTISTSSASVASTTITVAASLHAASSTNAATLSSTKASASTSSVATTGSSSSSKAVTTLSSVSTVSTTKAATTAAAASVTSTSAASKASAKASTSATVAITSSTAHAASLSSSSASKALTSSNASTAHNAAVASSTSTKATASTSSSSKKAASLTATSTALSSSS